MRLYQVKRSHTRMLEMMAVHYSQPKGFVGRNICYLIEHEGVIYGGIVSGSATKFLPGRNEFFKGAPLNSIINNIFFHCEKQDGRYPCRNFTQKVLEAWRGLAVTDWQKKYGDAVAGFETLIELPRTGEVYRRDGWNKVGQTIGYTCKRIGGKGTDSWTGRRVWNTKDLRPKHVFVRAV